MFGKTSDQKLVHDVTVSELENLRFKKLCIFLVCGFALKHVAA